MIGRWYERWINTLAPDEPESNKAFSYNTSRLYIASRLTVREPAVLVEKLHHQRPPLIKDVPQAGVTRGIGTSRTRLVGVMTGGFGGAWGATAYQRGVVAPTLLGQDGTHAVAARHVALRTRFACRKD